MASTRGKSRQRPAARTPRLLDAWRPASPHKAAGAEPITAPHHAARAKTPNALPSHPAHGPIQALAAPPRVPRQDAGGGSATTSNAAPVAPDLPLAQRRYHALLCRAVAAVQVTSRALLWLARPLRAPRAIAHERGTAPPVGWLAGVGLFIELCLFGLIVVTPLGGTTQSVSPLARAWAWLFAPARLFFPGWNLRIGTTPDQGRPAWPAIVFAVLLVLATAALLVALLRCVWQHGASRRHLLLALGVAVALGATLVVLPTLPSDDVFSYIIYGRIAALHHANPLVAVPASFPDDPFRTFVYWRNVRSVYGPIWLMASSGITILAEALGGNLSIYVLLFKLLGLASHLANMLLIWGILGVIAPRRRLLGTLLYGWNPLCLLEFCASGHNDALMLTFLLAGVYLLVRRWEIPALLAFGLSIATKYVPLALLPFYLYYVARQAMPHLAAASSERWGARVRSLWAGRRLLLIGARAAGWRLAVVLGVVAVATLPYWAGPGTLKAVLYSPPAERLDNSLLEAFANPLEGLAQAVFGMTPTGAVVLVNSIVKVVSLSGFVALWLLQFRRAKSLPGALEAWAWALMWYVLAASGWFWPWYVAWVVAVVALLPWTELSVTTVLLAGGVLALYAFRPLAASPLYGWRAFFEFGPAVVYLTWVTLARRRVTTGEGIAWPPLALPFVRRPAPAIAPAAQSTSRVAEPEGAASGV